MRLNAKVDRLLAEAEELARSDEQGRRLGDERDARLGQVLSRWEGLFEKALPLLDADDQQRASQAVERLAAEYSGPYANWLRDLADGCCRLPELSAEAMRSLLLAWLSPEADSLAVVCTACGLECPHHKTPPISEWELLPGRQPFDGQPPPWYDLPHFFLACPHCGGSLFGSGMTWAHLVEKENYPWMQLDGYVGKRGVEMTTAPAPATAASRAGRTGPDHDEQE
jgi:hypothetical protein